MIPRPLRLIPLLALPLAASAEDVKRLEVPSGTVLTVELVDALTSAKNREGESFRTKLQDGIWLQGRIVVPPGATIRGLVTEAKPSGRLKGVAKLSLTLSALELEGKSYELKTDTLTYSGQGHKGAHVGSGLMGALQGALYGMIFGGKDGAVIGAGAGAAAGAAGSIIGGKDDVNFAQGAKLMFELKSAVSVPEPPPAQASKPEEKTAEKPAEKPAAKQEGKPAKDEKPKPAS
ncbi:MAG: hypothetical protein HY553_03690 [Elusimicrobia bacterium]|nr:hypothetical protein [Elusimicrobiota bacterium]